MLDLIKKAIGIERGGSPAGAARPELRNELLAGVLLLEAAHSDYNFSGEEMAHVVDTIRDLYSLPGEYAEELMEIAHAERERSVDLHEFTRHANEKMSRDEKLRLLEGIWRIILADGRIDKYEEHYARRISDLLWLEHKDFIAAKLKVKGETERG